jgi:putative spermidine/putrescine transport system substrate-binding protein
MTNRRDEAEAFDLEGWSQDVADDIKRVRRRSARSDDGRSRRDFLRVLGAGAGALAAGSLLAACGVRGEQRAATPAAGGGSSSATPNEGTNGGVDVPDGTGQTLTLSVWGGETERAFVEAVVPAFTALTGAEVVLETGSGGERFNKLLAQKGSPTVDVFVNSAENVYQAKAQGLVRDLDPARVPTLNELDDWAKWPYGVSYGLLAFGLAGIGGLSQPLRSWSDLWRPDLAGRLAMPGIGHTQTPQLLTIISELNGGSIDDIEPGLAKLAELDPVLTHFFWTNWAPQAEAGEVVASPEFNYQVLGMNDAGIDAAFAFPEEKAIAADNTMSVVAGTGREDLAHAFIDTALHADVNARFCSIWYGSPANVNATILPEIEGRVPAAADILDQVRFFDVEVMAAKRPLWTDQMNQVVAPAWA